MTSDHQYVSLANEKDKVIVYEKGDLLFVFNFHSKNSYSDYDVGTFWRSDHFILLESDEGKFDGHKRLDQAHNNWFKSWKRQTNGRPYTIRIYLPSRTVMILCPFENAKDKTFGIPEMPKVENSEELLNGLGDIKPPE